MIHKKIAIIGLGNMGKIIAQRLLKEEIVSSKNLLLGDRDTDQSVARIADILVLAVKPKDLEVLAKQIKKEINTEKLVISMLAGINIEKLKKLLGKNQKIIRTIPNINASVGRSLTFWVKSPEVLERDVEIASIIFEALGEHFEISDEAILNKITPISGSGPAYFFYLTKLLEKAAVNAGMDKETAQRTARLTFLGSARLFRKSDESLEQLIDKVSSKGGVTEKVLKSLEKENFEKIFLKSIQKGIKVLEKLS